jgi:OmpA-OmpF porin, OOP family
MNRSEARTADGWRGFDRWATWIIPLAVTIPGLFFWMKGASSGAAGCCSAGAPPAAAIAVPTPVASPPVAPSVTPPVVAAAPNVASPTVASPTVDCGTIMNGVTVGFAVNRATLTDAGKRALDQTIVCLKEGKYEVAGHTDADGDAASNQQLSEARARTAVRYLVSQNVAAEKLQSAGFGETKPIADNGTVAGKAQNRRITFRPM